MIDAHTPHVVTRTLDGQINAQITAFDLQHAKDIVADYRDMDREHYGTDDNDHITYSVVPVDREDY